MINVSVHTLRLYESSGLIIPQRTESKRRLYSRNDIKRLGLIRYLIEEKGLNLAGIKLLLSLIPCWKIRKCSSKDQKKCDAFKTMKEPCWIVKNKCDLCAADDCRECPVYKKSASLDEVKKLIWCEK
ncbi:MAG: MerR family transcriptional regulator [Bacteriovoracaceae bacterium]|nr:MerR family transcriptional regulator [Bacteriovoracaceae bacterium]